MSKTILAFLFIFFFTLPLFAQSVDTAWVRRYNGPGNGDDYAQAIAVHCSGNVYVTGWSFGNGTYYDYATIRYKPNGDSAWVKRYNGPGNNDDYARDIATDDSGNVYVTGSIYVTGEAYDYATIKYDTFGNESWVESYNGPASGWDEAYSIVVDESGNVYITGCSVGSGTYDDYATIKYNPYGGVEWVRRYNGPANGDDAAYALAVDAIGNVYVTGESESTGTYLDYATIKYDPNGNMQWETRYNGPGNYDDRAYAIAVDDSGNVYVTGGSVGSGGDYDFATIKYDRNGNERWISRYNGSGHNTDIAYDIALDDSGNIYVTGFGYGSGTNKDYVTIKYNTVGTELWSREENGSGNGDDRAYAMTLDGSGNAYVTGEGYGSGTYEDCLTIKYDPIGNKQWEATYNGPGNGFDAAYDIAVHCNGNVYVTGTDHDSLTHADYITIKYVQFLRGDVNGDIKLSVSDVIYLINYLFKGGPPPNPLEKGDCNCDCKVTISDVVYLINYLFKGGPPPVC
jgi:uncharacterized delta-60 repeat protein